MGGQPYKIIWGTAAYKDYEAVLEYLFNRFGVKAALDFIDKVNQKQDLLASEPFIGRASERDSTIRSVLITVHNRLYYTVKDHQVHLLRMLDTRQDPQKNQYE